MKSNMPKKSKRQYVMYEGVLAHARKQGFTVRRLPVLGALAEITRGRQRGFVRRGSISLNTQEATGLSRNKQVAAAILTRAGVPVPRHFACRTLPGAQRAAEEIGYPVVVKPRNGQGGDGITLDVRTKSALKTAVAIALREESRFLVEEYMPGVDLRVYVLDGKIIGAAERHPPRALADGRRTVLELLDDFEAARRRKLGKIATLRRVRRDEVFERTLRSQRLTLTSVPRAGAMVVFRASSDLSKGGTSHTRTRLPAGVREACLKAARALGLRRAGIDILLQPEGSTRTFVVNEVNGNPAFPLHHFPDEGEPQDVLTPVLDALPRS